MEEKLRLTEEWDKTFPKSDKVDHRKVTFHNRYGITLAADLYVPCFLQALFPQKCRLNSSKLHGEFPQYCISSAGTLSGAGEEPLQAYKVY